MKHCHQIQFTIKMLKIHWLWWFDSSDDENMMILYEKLSASIKKSIPYSLPTVKTPCKLNMLIVWGISICHVNDFVRIVMVFVVFCKFHVQIKSVILCSLQWIWLVCRALRKRNSMQYTEVLSHAPETETNESQIPQLYRISNQTRNCKVI